MTKWCLISVLGRQCPVARFSDGETSFGLFFQKRDLQTSSLMPENTLVIILFYLCIIPVL